MQILSADETAVEHWGGTLAKDWMQTDPEAAGTLYIDGHVRVYHGSKAKLPKRYVARQKLALRGVTDYWVNDGLGRPFFAISSPFTHGLINMLVKEIIPKLIEDIPNQPTIIDLKANPLISYKSFCFSL